MHVKLVVSFHFSQSLEYSTKSFDTAKLQNRYPCKGWAGGLAHIVSYSCQSLMMIELASQFYFYLPWGQCLFSVLNVKVLLCDYEPSDGSSFQALIRTEQLTGWSQAAGLLTNSPHRLNGLRTDKKVLNFHYTV